MGELLAGKGVDYPHVTGSNITLRHGLRASAQQAEAIPMFGADDEPGEED